MDAYNGTHALVVLDTLVDGARPRIRGRPRITDVVGHPSVLQTVG